MRKLQAALDRLTPAVRRAVERALLKLRRRISLDTIVAILERGDTWRLAILTRGLDQDLRDASAVLEQAFRLGQQAAVVATPGLAGRLNLTNVLAIRAAEQAGATFVVGVTAQTREAIRVVVARAIQEGIPVRSAAQLIRPLIGLSARQAMAVVTARFEWLAQGVTADVVARRADRYAATLLKQRAELIARTEVIRASNDGQVAIWQQAKRQGLLPPNAEKQWIVTPDDRLCPRCQELDQVSVPIDAVFVQEGDTVSGPPLHPACRCALRIARKSLRRAA